MISRNKGMKLIVNALLSSLPAMTNVSIVCFLFVLIFAILGGNFFMGTFFSCSIKDNSAIKTKADCLKNGGDWEGVTESFDNVAIGIRTLFEMMTTEGWIDVMHMGVDGVGIDM